MMNTLFICLILCSSCSITKNKVEKELQVEMELHNDRMSPVNPVFISIKITNLSDKKIIINDPESVSLQVYLRSSNEEDWILTPPYTVIHSYFVDTHSSTFQKVLELAPGTKLEVERALIP